MASHGTSALAQEREKEGEQPHKVSRTVLQDLGVWVAAMRYDDLPPGTHSGGPVLTLYEEMAEKGPAACQR